MAGVRVLVGGTVTRWHLWHGLLHVSLLREHGLRHGVAGPRVGRGRRGLCRGRCGGRGSEDVAGLLRRRQHHAGLEQRRGRLGAFGRGLPREAQVAELRSQAVLLQSWEKQEKIHLQMHIQGKINKIAKYLRKFQTACLALLCISNGSQRTTAKKMER